MVEGMGHALFISHPGMLAQGWPVPGASICPLLSSLVACDPDNLQRKSRLLIVARHKGMSLHALPSALDPSQKCI